MKEALIEQLVNAVLYEGYILYPYRPSSKKNQRERFTFGRVYPESFSIAESGAEPCLMQTQCLVRGASPQSILKISLRFLQPLRREIGLFSKALPEWTGAEVPFRLVPELNVSGKLYQSWLEAVERRVDSPPVSPVLLADNHQSIPFRFEAAHGLEPIYDGLSVVGVIIRHQAQIEGTLELAADRMGSLFRLTVKILNQTKLRETDSHEPDAVLVRTLASTHTVLELRDAEFISLVDPAPEYQQALKACLNIGTWPVLVGDEAAGERGTLLSSPIILGDYPTIAPESAGPLFDGTEIDELLTLRIQTMTDQEKLEMRQVDEQARRLLERAESLPQERLLQMHGTIRPPKTQPPVEFDDFFGAHIPLKGATVGGVFLKPGDRVRIRPRARADVIDIALSGRLAVIEAIEEDLEHRIHLALVLEDDPGKDLGLLRQPGHRFFFGPDEVEPIKPTTAMVELAGDKT